MGIEKIDKNFEINHTVEKDDISWLDVREEPFELYGFYNAKTESVFKRMPSELGKKVSESLFNLAHKSSGGRVIFSTNSKYIAIRASVTKMDLMAHMPITGSSGFDMYLTNENGSCIYNSTFVPSTSDKYGYESLYEFDERKNRFVTINFPLYSAVENLFIGIEKDAKVEKGVPYKHTVPVVFYGSSITQGGCASRPGNMYPSMISRMLDTDYLCLGFSGNALGEKIMAEYIASLDMSCFVMDYDHNAPNEEHLKKTHYPFYEIIRKANEDLPIIMVSKSDTDRFPQTAKNRRDIVFSSYQKALANGDENVYFIDGATLFGTDLRDSCTVDGVHPNDLGFYRMAKVIGEKIKKIID